MAVKHFECKMGEEYTILDDVLADFHESSRVIVVGVSEFFVRFSGDPKILIREMMRYVRRGKRLEIIFINPFQWEEVSHGEARDGDHSADDSDVSDDDSGRLRSASNLLYSFVFWFTNHSEASVHGLSIISHGPRPKQLTGIVVNSSRIQSSMVKSSTEDIRARDLLISKDNGCICVRGSVGSGRTSLLFELSRKFPSVWVYTHEIVNCELGESSLIIRRLFSKASSDGPPSCVLMDDADLILNTSGRIMKEITEELGSCISEFSPKVKFFFAMDKDSKIDDFIWSKVDRFIDL